MKRLALILLLVLFLARCYTHINKVQNKWGPPAKVEDRGDILVYYYYFHKGQIRGSLVDAKRPIPTEITAGWLVVEFTTERNGKILNKRKYWKQPDLGGHSE